MTVLLGPQRRGQDHDAQDHHGPAGRRAAGSVRFAGRDIARAAHAGDRARGHRLRSREHGGLLRPHRAREPRCSGARQAAMDAARLEWILGFLPALREVLELPGRATSPAARSRWSPSRAPSSSRAGSCWSTSPPRGSRRPSSQNLLAAFRELKATGTTILLVEQNVSFVKSLGDHVAVMDDGRIVHAGAMRAFAADRGAAVAPAGARHGGPVKRHGRRCAAAPVDLARPAARAGRGARRCFPSWAAFPAWVTLTLAGLAMGMMIFIMASGLTLVFGLMDVLNFGHGAFVSVGRLRGDARAAAAGARGASADFARAEPRRRGARRRGRDARHRRRRAGSSSASWCAPCTASTCARSS